MQELSVLQKLQIIAFPAVLLAAVHFTGIALMWKRRGRAGGSAARWGLAGFSFLFAASVASMLGQYARLSIPRIGPGGNPPEPSGALQALALFSFSSWVATLIGSILIVRALWLSQTRAGAI
jgi:hypothetical protein